MLHLTEQRPPAGDRRSSFDRMGPSGAPGGLSSAFPEDDANSVFASSISDSQRPSVIGLRDRLLREARNERERCLEVAQAAERKRSEFRASCHVATQTEPVVVLDGGGAAGLGAGCYPPHGPLQHVVGWSAADSAAQAEALRTIALLGERGNQGRLSEGRIGELEAELRAERASRQELDVQLSHERGRKDAAQQQVLCLEYELDGKEAALQVAERTLERRDADLQQAQLQLRALQERGPSVAFSPGPGVAYGEDARCKALRAQLLEREHQLELKDQHISRLLNVLRQHRSVFVEEDSTACGSERSALTLSTYG